MFSATKAACDDFLAEIRCSNTNGDDVSEVFSGSCCDHIYCKPCCRRVADKRQCLVCGVGVDPKEIAPHRLLNELLSLGRRLGSGLTAGVRADPTLDGTLLPLDELPPPASDHGSLGATPEPSEEKENEKESPVPKVPESPSLSQLGFLAIRTPRKRHSAPAVGAPPEPKNQLKAPVSRSAAGEESAGFCQIVDSGSVQVLKEISPPRSSPQPPSAPLGRRRSSRKQSTSGESKVKAAPQMKKPATKRRSAKSDAADADETGAPKSTAAETTTGNEKALTAASPDTSITVMEVDDEAEFARPAPVGRRSSRPSSTEKPPKASEKPKTASKRNSGRRAVSLGSIQVRKAADQTRKSIGDVSRGGRRLSALKRNRKGETALHVAAIAGDASRVAAELAEGASANSRDFNYTTPLHEAAVLGHIAVLKLLIGAGANVNAPGADGETPLHDAVSGRHTQAVAALLAAGADPSLADAFGRTAKDVADVDAIRKLLGKKVAPPQPLESVRFVPWQRDRPLAMLTSALSDEGRAEVRAFTGLMKATLLNDWGPKATHLIIGEADESAGGDVCRSDSFTVRRTMKALLAVQGGLWVVSLDWCRQSAKARELLDEEPFEVDSIASTSASQEGSVGAPCRSRLSRMLGVGPILPFQPPPSCYSIENRGLFWGCSFFFAPGHEFKEPKKAELERLIKLGDGAVLKREPSGEAGEGRRVWHDVAGAVGLFVVYSPEAELPPLPSPPHRLVSPTWLLDSVSQFRILPAY